VLLLAADAGVRCARAAAPGKRHDFPGTDLAGVRRAHDHFCRQQPGRRPPPWLPRSRADDAAEPARTAGWNVPGDLGACAAPLLAAVRPRAIFLLDREL